MQKNEFFDIEIHCFDALHEGGLQLPQALGFSVCLYH